jgi:hypothetical protein
MILWNLNVGLPLVGAVWRARDHLRNGSTGLTFRGEGGVPGVSKSHIHLIRSMPNVASTVLYSDKGVCDAVPSVIAEVVVITHQE